MKVKNLKNGAVVELRNGKQMIKINNTFLLIDNLKNFMPINAYTEDGRCIGSEISKEYDIMKANNNVENSTGYCNNAVCEALADKWTWIRENILDSVEKQYLSTIIKPFKNRKVYIIKQEAFNDSYITITVDGECIDFPYFKNKKMYKNMKLNKPYTIEDLKLFNEE